MLNRCAITSHAQAICDILCVCFSLCLRKRNKRLADLPECVAERKFRADRERILFIQPGEGHKIGDELGQPSRLRLDVMHPFILVMLHGQHIRTGGDGGQGRFQLMTCVGDKLLLCLHVFEIRRNGSPGKEHDKAEHYHKARGGDGQRDEQQ